jgi:Protein of unknown function (DUF4013)
MLFMVGKALTFPARDPQVVSKCWWVPLVNLVPLFNFPIMLGWKVSIARRVGLGTRDPLPESGDFGLFLAEGIMIKLISLVYYVPLVVAMTVCGSRLLPTILTLVHVLYENLFKTQPFSSFLPVLARIVFNVLMELFLPTLYCFGIWPLFHAGLVRYILEGRKRVFFDILGNARLLGRQGEQFFLAFFVDYTARIILLIILSPLLTATFLGAFAIPFVIWPMYYLFSGHILGQVTASATASAQTVPNSFKEPRNYEMPVPTQRAPAELKHETPPAPSRRIPRAS